MFTKFAQEIEVLKDAPVGCCEGDCGPDCPCDDEGSCCDGGGCC